MITTPGTTTYYIGEHLEKINDEYTAYLFNGNLRIAKVSSSGEYYYHKDHLGSTLAMTDSGGNVVESIGYTPYGEEREHTGSTISSYRYTDQEYDTETGLYNYKARLYDPITGRFVSPDTLVPDYSNPQSLNRYSYVKNNPLRYNDPTGHCEEGLGCEYSNIAPDSGNSVNLYEYFQQSLSNINSGTSYVLDLYNATQNLLGDNRLYGGLGYVFTAVVGKGEQCLGISFCVIPMVDQRGNGETQVQFTIWEKVWGGFIGGGRQGGIMRTKEPLPDEPFFQPSGPEKTYGFGFAYRGKGAEISWQGDSKTSSVQGSFEYRLRADRFAPPLGGYLGEGRSYSLTFRWPAFVLDVYNGWKQILEKQ